MDINATYILESIRKEMRGCVVGEIIKETFNDFVVYKSDNHNCFLHIQLKDDASFYEALFEYFFNETRFLNYIENRMALNFEPTDENYVTLYKQLSLYIDDENSAKSSDVLEKEVLEVLQNEYAVEKREDGDLYIKLDKIGKIGEFIFCNLLTEFFGYSCVIPKVNLTTDRNMSVYGIDAVFFCPENNLILFGESKVSKSIENGISLIKKSLSTYEKQIDEEFVLILSNRLFSDKMGALGDKYGDIINKSVSMKQFISKAEITDIGIPIFIAHGGEVNVNEIFKKLESIRKINIHGIDAKYITISLPIISKSKFMAVLTAKIKERRDYYESIL